MSSAYMRIEGLDKISGSSIIEVNGKKGFMPIGGASFNMHRSMQFKIGQGSNIDVGAPFISPLAVRREIDGATPYLITAFFEHKSEDCIIEIITTKFARDGKGLTPAFIMTLDGARINSYASDVASVDGAEQFTVICATFQMVHYTEDALGKVEKGQTVKFDIPKGELVSKAK